MKGCADCKDPSRIGRSVYWRFSALALLLSALAPIHSIAALEVEDPVVACGLMREQGLRTLTGHPSDREDGFRCSSRRKALPLGGNLKHEIQYYATGDKGSTATLNLRLFIVSRQEVQAAHRRLLQYTQTLMEKAAGMPLPKDLSKSILSGSSGIFSVGGVKVEVRKVQVRGSSYELIVSVKI